RADRFRAQLVLKSGHQGTGGMVGKRCHERTDQRIQFPAGAGRYGHNRMYGPEQTEYRLRFFANILCLCRRRLNTGHIPFMAGLRFVGLRHHKQHLLMSPVQDVSPEILIHRQGTVIGFNQPQYQVKFRQNVTVQGFILCIPVPALAHPGQVSDNHAVTVTTQTEALHFPGAGVNITDRCDLPLKQRITE
ncbi:hypothetical protein EC01288_4841, partial [Escherichia coli 0.1288]